MTENIGEAPDGADAHVREVVWTMLGARRQKPAELALRLGISKSAIYSRLSGKTAFTVAEVAAMGQHFDLPPSVFFAGNAALLVGRASVEPGSITVRKSTAVRHLPEPNASPVRRPALSLVAA